VLGDRPEQQAIGDFAEHRLLGFGPDERVVHRTPEIDVLFEHSHDARELRGELVEVGALDAELVERSRVAPRDIGGDHERTSPRAVSS
jgi:hypothetical protein